MSSTIRERQPAAKSKLNRNDPCWCGSGKKYKRCHLDEDQAAVSQAYEAEQLDPNEHADHAEHLLCRVYMPQSTGVPAHLRRDFNHLVSEMRRSGATLMHIYAPRVLAKDEADYYKSIQVLRDNGITADFNSDPRSQELAVSQTYFDHLFGAGVYRLCPASTSFRSYPKWSRRIGTDGAIELCVNRETGLGFFLFNEKVAEWDKLGIPSDPRLLRSAAIAADLVADLIPACAEITKTREVDDQNPWGGLRHVLYDIVIAGGLASGEANGDPPPHSLTARIAIGLAFPEVSSSSGDAQIDALPITELSRALLREIATELVSDQVAQALVLAGVAQQWATASGLQYWYESIPSHLRIEAGINDPPGTSKQGIPESGPAEFPLPVAIPASTPLVTPPSLVRSTPAELPDPFVELDDIGRRTQAAASELRDEIRERLSRTQSLQDDISALQSQIREREVEQAAIDEAVHALEDNVDRLIERDRQNMTATLHAILAGAGVGLASAASRWAEGREGREHASNTLTPAEQQHARVLSSYEESVRSGVLDSLDPTLRSLLQHQADAARDALGPGWKLSGHEWPEPHTVVSVPLSLTVSGGRTRITAVLPFDAINSEALPADSPDTALAAVVTHQMAVLLNELTVSGGDHDVDVQDAQLATHICFSGPHPRAEAANLVDEEWYYVQLCQEAADQHDLLRMAGVKVRFHSVAAELLDDLTLNRE
jgi:SEC-C motif